LFNRGTSISIWALSRGGAKLLGSLAPIYDLPPLHRPLILPVTDVKGVTDVCIEDKGRKR
jgi:hypothetical protein